VLRLCYPRVHGTKYVSLNDGLYSYLSGLRSDATDPLLQQLRAETAALGEEISKCQISDEQGTFLSLLTAAMGAKSAIEVEPSRVIAPCASRAGWLTEAGLFAWTPVRNGRS